MPEFPRVQSKGVLTTQQPSIQASAGTQGQILEQTAKLGSQVQEAGIKWSNAVDTIQKTTSLANFETGMADITARAQNDPNYNNSDQYFKEIEKLKTDNLKGFSSKTAETEMGIEFGYKAKVGQIQIQNLYRKKMIDVGQTSTLRLLDMAVQNPTPDSENKIDSILGEQVRAGIFDNKDAYALSEKYKKQAKYNQFLIDLQGSPAVAEENLSKNAYGFDIKELSSAKSVYKTEVDKIQAVNQDQILTDYLNGNPPDTIYIKQQMNDKKIDPKFAESMIEKINNFKPDPISKDTSYIEFQNRMMDIQGKGDKASIQEITKLMTDTMQAHSHGLLDKEDVQRILKDRNEVLQKKLDPMAESVLGKTNPKTLFQRLSFWSDEYADKKPEIKARMYRELMDGMSQGQDGNVLISDIVNKEIENQMSENLTKKDRQFAVNPDTKKRIYSDDGGATWFDEKTGKEVK